jgi:acid phosphatase (class A)
MNTGNNRMGLFKVREKDFTKETLYNSPLKKRFGTGSTESTSVKPLFLFFLLLIFFGCAHLEPQNQSDQAPVEIRPGFLAGYLKSETIPNSLNILPSPPETASPEFLLDQETYQKTRALRGTARWALATADADLMFPQAAGTFSCTLGAPVTEKDTPHLYRLMRRTLTDAGLSTYPAKNKYKRLRPFMVNGEVSCTPEDEEKLGWSYPSGHAAVGWAWALILSEIAPEQTDALLARGLAFGQSRVVCGVHWVSDVIEGRIMGAGTVARLHSDPAFRADLKAAKAELAAVRAKGLTPTRDCRAEAEALALLPPLVP